MSGALVLVSWMLIGYTAATFGAPPDERHVAWRVAGMLLGPLWICIRVDRPRASSRVVRSRRLSAGRVAP